MKLRTITTRAERGFATVANLQCGIEVALWHQTIKGLGHAYEKITGSTFYDSLAQPTAIYHDRNARKTH
jgi:hypothetical protein